MGTNKISRCLAASALLCLMAAAPALSQEPVSGDGDGVMAAMRLAAKQHPTVTSKREELRALGLDLEASEAQRYPTLQLQASSTADVAGQSPGSNDQYYNVVAVARQPLWVGGRIDGSIDQAGVKLKIGVLNLAGIQRQLMENTAATYSAVQGARQRLNAANLNIVEHERLKELIVRRASGGIASQADVQLASSRLSQALAQRFQLEAVLQSSLNELRALTQQDLPALVPVEENLVMLPGSTRIVPEVTSASFTVQQRLQEVALARTASDLAAASMLPSLYAKVEQDLYNSSRYGETPQGTRVGVVLEGAVEGLGVSGWRRVKSSDARVDAARRDVEVARNDARRQAQNLLTEMLSLQHVQQSYESLVKSTEETLASFMRQYDAGRKSWVDVLNTQRELSEARLTLEQTRSSLVEKRLRLAVQLGIVDRQVGVVQ